jgi:subtilisin family serine protease
VNVAVIDTGIDPSHPDLNVVGGTNCAPGLGFNDLNGHGSHVAGTIAARDDGNVVGVAPGANLYAVKVLTDAGAGLTTDIICGIDWVTATRTDANPSNDIAVANMSLGGGGRTTTTAATPTTRPTTRRSATRPPPGSRTSSPPGTTASTSARPRRRPTARC